MKPALLVINNVFGAPGFAQDPEPSLGVLFLPLFKCFDRARATLAVQLPTARR